MGCLPDCYLGCRLGFQLVFYYELLSGNLFLLGLVSGTFIWFCPVGCHVGSHKGSHVGCHVGFHVDFHVVVIWFVIYVITRVVIWVVPGLKSEL
jgi:hypothetical protein